MGSAEIGSGKKGPQQVQHSPPTPVPLHGTSGGLFPLRPYFPRPRAASEG